MLAFFLGNAADAVIPLECIFDRAVREAESSYIDTGIDQRSEHRFALGGGSDGRDDLGPTRHGRHASGEARSPSTLSLILCRYGNSVVTKMSCTRAMCHII